eukprot:TRINITY_DN2499_c0_g1_i1.p1 TRINITY_DN2499_c0_g1~~TRINITY_DN2499_c0_g1_i1.p1  ORF type:complete len:572 (+),score=185.89 TRINITY_DN2499_c0_g1_i1:1236-2951(+)
MIKNVPEADLKTTHNKLLREMQQLRDKLEAAYHQHGVPKDEYDRMVHQMEDELREKTDLHSRISEEAAVAQRNAEQLQRERDDCFKEAQHLKSSLEESQAYSTHLKTELQVMEEDLRRERQTEASLREHAQQLIDALKEASAHIDGLNKKIERVKVAEEAIVQQSKDGLTQLGQLREGVTSLARKQHGSLQELGTGLQQLTARQKQVLGELHQECGQVLAAACAEHSGNVTAALQSLRQAVDAAAAEVQQGAAQQEAATQQYIEAINGMTQKSLLDLKELVTTQERRQSSLLEQLEGGHAKVNRSPPPAVDVTALGAALREQMERALSAHMEQLQAALSRQQDAYLAHEDLVQKELLHEVHDHTQQAMSELQGGIAGVATKLKSTPDSAELGDTRKHIVACASSLTARLSEGIARVQSEEATQVATAQKVTDAVSSKAALAEAELQTDATQLQSAFGALDDAYTQHVTCLSAVLNSAEGKLRLIKVTEPTGKTPQKKSFAVSRLPDVPAPAPTLPPVACSPPITSPPATSPTTSLTATPSAKQAPAPPSGIPAPSRGGRGGGPAPPRHTRV